MNRGRNSFKKKTGRNDKTVSFCALLLCGRHLSFRACAQNLSIHPHQWSTGSGKSPTESDYGQAEEGAEGGVERLDLGRRPGFC